MPILVYVMFAWRARPVNDNAAPPPAAPAVVAAAAKLAA